MRFMSYGGWKTLVLFSVIVPMGLFTSFRLAGIVGQPLNIAQTITANDPMYWSVERPDYLIPIRDNLRSYYQGDINLAQEVVVEYFQTPDSLFESDYVSLGVCVNASIQTGYVYEINLIVAPQNPEDLITLLGLTNAKHENLSAIQGEPINRTTSELACVGVGYPHQTYFQLPLQWVFYGPRNQTETLQLISEVVYYNGTVFKKVVQSFLLNMRPRLNNTTPQTATELYPNNNYTGLYLRWSENEDYYYKLHADQGERITLHIATMWTDTLPLYYSVDVFDPAGEQVSSVGWTHDYSAVFTSKATGYWIIRLKCTDDQGYYYVEIGV